MSIRAAAAGAENLVENPGFEAGEFQAGEARVLPGWSVRYGRDAASILYTLEAADPKSGARCLRMAIPAARQQVARLAPTQLYAVDAGCRVTVSFVYRSQSGGPGAESAIWIELYDAQRQEMATSAAKRTRLAFAEAWTPAVVEFQVPDDDPKGYHVGFFFRHINPGSLWVDDVSLVVTPGVGLFTAEASGLTPPALPEATGVAAADETSQAFFAGGGFHGEKTASGVVTITTGGSRMVVRGDDGGVVSAWSGGEVHYPGRGQGGLFRDLFWMPEAARWGEDASGAYEVGAASVDADGNLRLVLTRVLTHPALAGLHLTKEYVIEPGLRRLWAEIAILNQGDVEREFRYWSWHRLGVPSSEAVVAVQGDPALVAGPAAPGHLFAKPHFSEWVRVSDRYYLCWDRSRPASGGAYLDRLHVWNDSICPALGLIGKAVALAPGKAFQARLRCHAIPRAAAAPAATPRGDDVRLVHPYGVKKKLAFRASIHNHSQYTPGYTHAPTPSGDLLAFYRDLDCSPRYRIVAITEHSRLTLPANTDPPGSADPPWGVEGMLFIPGGELGLGSSTGGVAAGDLFGEINCVGLPTASADPSDQKSFYHSQVSSRDPGAYLRHLVCGGAYVGLCHPRAQLDGEGVQRWNTSGYTYDELDLIFGNPEKLLPPLEQLPLGLEIGNQGYDFTARTAFTNAEALWDMLLARGHRLHGTCSDDSHGRPGCRGWIVPFMDELTHEDFMASLLSGNFYASQGPAITGIEVAGRTITVTTDQPSLIEFIGRGGDILAGFPEATRGAYRVEGDEIYVRARVTRDCPETGLAVGGGIGHRRSAWTNPFYLE
ncbi:MAG: hypothetical protein GX595_09060 [Lentisphaerae bacterium]|nr:hypothetical protein [Lentisphaerota bacterium]